MAKSRRDPAKESLWRQTLRRFTSSGLSVREFCRREQLAESAFYAWRRTIGRRDANNAGPAFVSAVIRGQPEDDERLVLKLACGLELRLPSAIPAARLAELVCALEARGRQ